MEFVAIDLETANADMASICQIGLVCYRGGEIVDTLSTYIDPQDYFDGMNISIHGIDEETVSGAPTFEQFSDSVYEWLDNQVAVCHTHFDRVAMKQACDKQGIRFPKCAWLDSARVTRRAWPEFAWKGYGLHNVCKTLGYEFKHHDALEDAKAAGHVLLAASEECDLDIAGWLKRVSQPIGVTRSGTKREPVSAITKEGNPEGPFFGDIMVFTGALEIPRTEAANMAAEIGFQIRRGVTKRTNILIVGDQDISRLAGHKKSSKHRKAEELISIGIPIRILRETDFKALFDSIE